MLPYTPQAGARAHRLQIILMLEGKLPKCGSTGRGLTAVDRKKKQRRTEISMEDNILGEGQKKGWAYDSEFGLTSTRSVVLSSACS